MTTFIPSLLKEKNSRIIYNLFADGNAYSKADISRLTGISAPTVIKVIDSFIEKKILVNAGEGEGSVGRKPNLLTLNAKAYHAVGVDFQNGKVRVGLVDLEGAVTGAQERELTGSLRDMLLNEVIEMIDLLVKQSGIDRQRLLGVGLGLPGVVDGKEKTVEFAYAIGMNEKTDCTELLEELESKCGLPVYIENDINAAAIGEFTLRGLDELKDLLYISLGTGLGAGIVLSGKLRHGIHNFAGEIAYASFDEGFDSKKSPIGWLEQRLSVRDALERMEAGELDAQVYLEDISKALALTIANFSVLLDFDQVVIGGLLSIRFGSEILTKIEKNLIRMSSLKINCSLACTELPEITGCAFIVFDNRLKDIL